MRKTVLFLAVLAGVGLLASCWLTQPERANPADFDQIRGDAVRGARIFSLGGCASCHSAPGAEGPARLILSGGKSFASPFGTFFAPNISPDTQNGIGGWSNTDLINAMRYGTAPDGQHYYPAFPYTSYARASMSDLIDLKGFLDSLPATSQPNTPHEIPFPFNIRRTLGLWKLLFLNSDWVIDDPNLSETAKQGRNLVEGLGHCAECHTPRGMLGNPQHNAWLTGAPNPDGKGRIPPLAGLKWSADDIAEYLKSGFTPDFDTAGGAMVEVIENTAQLSDKDRAAIAAYIKALNTP